MSRRTWPEYLADAERHLAESRAAVASGMAIPASPVRPVDPIPDELRSDARMLAIGYDQLAVEVTTRMHQIVQHRTTRSLAPGPQAHFVDRHA